MANRWKDWWSQAERDLEHARESAAAERHEWACFAAVEAALRTWIEAAREARPELRGVVYTPAEWATVRARGDRFARMLERNVVRAIR